ncbi:MAG: E2F/DP family winged-helix DNA-binding domain protein [Candidatus Bathyarchaeota archaeon BA1]|nr:MAG: E2F/DP family winged-helix DNA-binding domain protein [Candidatus Bathyarchaeota archaeon BA1]
MIALGSFDFAKIIVDFLIKKREASMDELRVLVPERRLYDVLTVLEAAGLIERAKNKVTWIGGFVGREIVIEGPVQSVTTSPIEVRVVGIDPLKVKIKEL